MSLTAAPPARTDYTWRQLLYLELCNDVTKRIPSIARKKFFKVDENISNFEQASEFIDLQ